MNEFDRQELESLKRRQRQLTDELTMMGRRLGELEIRLQPGAPSPLPRAEAEPLVIAPLRLEPVMEAAPRDPAPVLAAPPDPTKESMLDALLKARAGALAGPETPAPEKLRLEVAASPMEVPPIITETQPNPEAQGSLVVLKTACQLCGGNIEYPLEETGQTIACPHCQGQTLLAAETMQEPEPAFERPAPVPVIPLPPRIDMPMPERAAQAVEGGGEAAGSSSFELRLGTFWMVRVGVVMLLTALGFSGYYAYKHYIPQLGPLGKVSLLYLASGALLGAGAWFQRRAGRESLRNYGQVVLAGGLAAVYFTTYAAHHIPPLRVISSALLDGLLLLGWAGFIVWLADRKKSEVLALFAIGLAWYTSLVTHVGLFTLYSNLLLTLAAVFFLIRNQWTTLSFASLLGTYGAYGYWRFYQNGVWLFDLGASPELLWHGITVLAGYWIAFSAAVFLSRAEPLQGGRRLSFLTLNNGAFFGLVVISMYSSHSTLFWKFCLVYGVVLLGLSWGARLRWADDPQAHGGYVTQGTLLVTVGLIAKFTGMQLGLMLAVESATLLVLGHWRQNRLLLFGAHVVGAMAVGWGIDGTRRFDPTSMMLGAALGGFMAFNAVWATRRADEEDAAPIRLSPGFFSGLAVIMWLVTTWANVERPNLPPVLAVEALLLTGLVYALRVRELTLIGQANLLLAQVLWLLGVSPAGASTEPRPWWNPAVVLAVSVALGHWWQRQRTLRLDAGFVRGVQVIYSLAAVGVLHFWVNPLCRDEVWLALSAVLAVVVTVYGLATRAWPLAICGQLLLGVSGWQFFKQLFDGHPGWGFALVPMAVLLGLAGAVVRYCEGREEHAEALPAIRQVGVIYRGAAVIMGVIWVYEYIPAPDRFWVLALAGAAVFAFNGWRRDREGLILSGILTAAGLLSFVAQGFPGAGQPVAAFHVPSLLAILLILAQQQGLRRWPNHFAVPAAWNDGVIILGGAALGLFATRWIMVDHDLKHLPLAWSVLAVLLAGAGAALKERTYGWLNLAAIGGGLGLFVVLAIGSELGPNSRAVFAGHLAPILLLIIEQQVARRFQERLPLVEDWHHVMIVTAGICAWLFVTRAIQVQSGGFFLTVGWTVLGFVVLVLGFVLRERMHRWTGLAMLGLAIARVGIYDFWRLDTLHQILSALALGVALVVLGFIYNRYQETIRKWL